MMKIIRYLLLPIVPIYYGVTWLRNILYDFGIKKSVAFELPVIGVGNLSVGGTGKTPMVEYLIRLLSPQYRLATLSRGYKRHSKGFIIADGTATANSLGDEPFQLYQKHKDIIVSVDTDRVHGISQLMALAQPPEVVVLDDAFQHRKVKAGFYILLTSFDALYVDDMLLPTGNLREPVSGAKRANVIVVTKCPVDISEEQKETIIRKLEPLDFQEVFFASITYGQSVRNKMHNIPLERLGSQSFTLVTGIANPKPLVEYLNALGMQFEHLKFKDHHDFTTSDIGQLKQKPLIVTTEKDMVRLEPYFAEDDQIFSLPITMKIDRQAEFDALVSSFVK